MALITFDDKVTNIPLPMSYDFQTDTASGEKTLYHYYTVSGDGFVIVSASVITDSTSSYGSSYGYINQKGVNDSAYTTIVYNYNRLPSSLGQAQGVSMTAGIQVSDGDTLQMRITQTKGGSKTFMYSCLCYGCTVTYS